MVLTAHPCGPAIDDFGSLPRVDCHDVSSSSDVGVAVTSRATARRLTPIFVVSGANPLPDAFTEQTTLHPERERGLH